MGSVETLVVLPVAPLYIPIVPRRIGTDYLMADAMSIRVFLKQGRFVPAGGKTVCELGSVICLDAFNMAWKGFDKVVYKHG